MSIPDESVVPTSLGQGQGQGYGRIWSYGTSADTDIDTDTDTNMDTYMDTDMDTNTGTENGTDTENDGLVLSSEVIRFMIQQAQLSSAEDQLKDGFQLQGRLKDIVGS